MPTTSRWALPYPALAEAADVPADMGELAVALDGVAMESQGTLASRPAANTATNKRYWATDTRQEFRSDGTTWHLIATAGAPWVNITGLTGFSGGGISYMKDNAGNVRFRGYLDVTGSGRTGDTMYTMPAGFRPTIASSVFLLPCEASIGYPKDPTATEFFKIIVALGGMITIDTIPSASHAHKILWDHVTYSTL